jgi:hypothetical protein
MDFILIYHEMQFVHMPNLSFLRGVILAALYPNSFWPAFVTKAKAASKLRKNSLEGFSRTGHFV